MPVIGGLVDYFDLISAAIYRLLFQTRDGHSHVFGNIARPEGADVAGAEQRIVPIEYNYCCKLIPYSIGASLKAGCGAVPPQIAYSGNARVPAPWT